MRSAFLAVIVLAWLNTSLFAESQTERINRFFEKSFQERVDRSPMRQALLGIKKDYSRWDDLSDEAATETLALTAAQLATLRTSFDFDQLDRQEQLSYRLFEHEAETEIGSFAWRFHEFPVNQMHGIHSELPSFLINFHRVDSVADAEAYIERLQAVPDLFEQVVETMQLQREREIVPPRFMFPLVIDDCRNILKGVPFDDSEEPSTLWRDFQDKVEKLSISDEQQRTLVAKARSALLGQVRPAYERMIEVLEQLQQSAAGDLGAWSLPLGGDYYNQQLRVITTTELSAEEIHQIGLEEVSRIHNEMRDIMRKVKFSGNLQEFFEFMREDGQFYYPDTDEGRGQYLKDAMQTIDRMKASLDFMFITKPRADMIVKRVEPFREKSAGTAFYFPPSPDGSRPGIYYANLSDMKRMPTYQMEALAFHEGIPGHHMQLSIAQELEGIPKFRKFSWGYTAYVEGWGLYCERLPKEFGYYKDPYSDFGRLAAEVWRAARLVVDTGLHHYRWSRQQAIDYLIENTPDAENECIRAINRYLVMPGQATAYKVGMLKILELRQHAIDQLGDQFDIRRFHDVVLANGPMPLDILAEQVERWIDETR